jgi:hypothetical protein
MGRVVCVVRGTLIRYYFFTLVCLGIEDAAIRALDRLDATINGLIVCVAGWAVYGVWGNVAFIPDGIQGASPRTQRLRGFCNALNRIMRAHPVFTGNNLTLAIEYPV